eukprot:366148-Chlamydomonas_euryale.AAC.4
MGGQRELMGGQRELMGGQGELMGGDFKVKGSIRRKWAHGGQEGEEEKRLDVAADAAPRARSWTGSKRAWRERAVTQLPAIVLPTKQLLSSLQTRSKPAL